MNFLKRIWRVISCSFFHSKGYRRQWVSGFIDNGEESEAWEITCPICGESWTEIET